MENKQKIKNFFSNLKKQIVELKSNRVFLICCLLTALYFASGFFKWIEISVSVVALIFMATLSLQQSFCIFMFLHSFTLSHIGYDSCFMVTLIGYCIILLVKYLIGVKKKHYQVYKPILIALACFYAITSLISVGKSLYMGAFLYYTYLPLAYLLFAMRKDFNIAQGMNYMFGGLMTSCAFALFSIIVPFFQYNVMPGNRFRAFFNNTNYLYMRTLFVISYYMYRNLSNKLSNLKFITILAICTLITFATLSKTGIVILCLLIGIYLILFLKQDFKKRIKYVGIFGLILLGICLICHNYLSLIFNRFVEAFNSKNFIRSLLTGRDEIWTLYFNAIFKSPWTALFGNGLLTEQVFVANQYGPTETHNFYIFLLYRFGIVGTIAFGYVVYLFIKYLAKDKPKFVAYLPLIYILLESLCDNTFKCYNFTYFIFAIMILFMSCNDKIKHTQTEQIEEKKN
ncbi:MAG: O-antigen ligase family protein [Clostridia bacterium]|nr:O-antigen ligase family protein [Clostridia bacterium]